MWWEGRSAGRRLTAGTARLEAGERTRYNVGLVEFSPEGFEWVGADPQAGVQPTEPELRQAPSQAGERLVAGAAAARPSKRGEAERRALPVWAFHLGKAMLAFRVDCLQIPEKMIPVPRRSQTTSQR